MKINTRLIVLIMAAGYGLGLTGCHNNKGVVPSPQPNPAPILEETKDYTPVEAPTDSPTQSVKPSAIEDPGEIKESLIRSIEDLNYKIRFNDSQSSLGKFFMSIYEQEDSQPFDLETLDKLVGEPNLLYFSYLIKNYSIDLYEIATRYPNVQLSVFMNDVSVLEESRYKKAIEDISKIDDFSKITLTVSQSVVIGHEDEFNELFKQISNNGGTVFLTGIYDYESFLKFDQSCKFQTISIVVEGKEAAEQLDLEKCSNAVGVNLEYGLSSLIPSKIVLNDNILSLSLKVYDVDDTTGTVEISGSENSNLCFITTTTPIGKIITSDIPNYVLSAKVTDEELYRYANEASFENTDYTELRLDDTYYIFDSQGTVVIIKVEEKCSFKFDVNKKIVAALNAEKMISLDEFRRSLTPGHETENESSKTMNKR